ncbi:prenyltransferase/squalene oxidase repeat-containing protein [Actimicrobium sp. CCC2.4]|uniref:prenyltransferase/squalene oxidase repeat-containing protein n=1 Tax=Actimicrobium sp. CCC2.4 TaxID=3048606 RepID=UPI002AC8A661|nr:prenyltransferase/squalene oxidase repeat-containing protein [Actimicrobium sp. CCC2.4]MEB0133837.1 prenyltransferase/squalene oxidase repeat-containing protein [Actimicrobium sp. CCC2.4]WPX31379.1 prenyltransferase/squalene oxidase repeat-containing protein [Actimicrobium sp. CCC2.4]
MPSPAQCLPEIRTVMNRTDDAILRGAMDRAIAYLLSRQAADGHWEDYCLPVGSSDAWVTGYVGVALAESDDRMAVRRSTDAAACWLETRRPYPQGWGYNNRTGPDADSSAFALMLLQRTGKTPLPADLDWLRRYRHAGGGFATYLRDDAWGIPHSDVTATALLALEAGTSDDARQDVLDLIARTRDADGTWPSYWWRTCHYATWWTLRLLRAAGAAPEGRVPVVDTIEQRAIHGAFDLALVTGIASLQQASNTLIATLVNELTGLQRPDGAWTGSAHLRVTDPDCARPWTAEVACGHLYIDEDHLISTATALRVLAQVGESASVPLGDRPLPSRLATLRLPRAC